MQLGVVEEGAGLLVGGVAGAQLPDLLLPPLHPLLVDPARTARRTHSAGQRADRGREWRARWVKFPTYEQRRSSKSAARSLNSARPASSMSDTCTRENARVSAAAHADRPIACLGVAGCAPGGCSCRWRGGCAGCAPPSPPTPPARPPPPPPPPRPSRPPPSPRRTPPRHLLRYAGSSCRPRCSARFTKPHTDDGSQLRIRKLRLDKTSRQTIQKPTLDISNCQIRCRFFKKKQKGTQTPSTD